MEISSVCNKQINQEKHLGLLDALICLNGSSLIYCKQLKGCKILYTMEFEYF